MAKFFTIQADIYKLDPALINETPALHIDKLLREYSLDEKNYSYKEVPLQENIGLSNGFELKLFVGEKDDRAPGWLSFLDSLVPTDHKPKLKHLKRNFPSFALFIFNDSSTYVITKGAGSHVIRKEIEELFGISVLERLIDPAKSDLRSAEERGVLGSVIAQSRYFKRDYTISDDRSFGMFYSGISALISNEKLEKYLGIKTNKNHLVIEGENSLKINSRVNIMELLERLQLIDELLKSGERFPINKFRILKSKELNRPEKGSKLEHLINEELMKLTFSSHMNAEEIEVYHPDIVEYLKSTDLSFYVHQDNGEYIDRKLSHDTRITLKDILNLFNYSPTNYPQFKSNILAIFGGFSSDHSDNPVAIRCLEDWLTGEIEFNGQKYFRFDARWFIYELDFIEDVNISIQALFEKLPGGDKLKTWNHSSFTKHDRKDSERQYNLSFKGEGYTICDTALIENIEICDFFKVVDDQIILYHVKSGWGQNIRIVYNQIVNGAKGLAHLRMTRNMTLIKQYFDDVKARNYNKDDLDFETFRDSLLSKNVKFCLVYGSKNTKSREDEIMSSKSTLAKLCVLRCEHEIRSIFSFSFDLIKVSII